MANSTILLYLLTFPNGKRYIGITSKTLRRRMIVHFSHARTGRKGALQNAIRKYGADAVTATVLVMCGDWDYLCDLEQRAISVFNTFVPHGYNQTLGGEGLLGVRLSEDARKRQAASVTGKNMGNQFASGYRHTEEAKKKISDAGKGRVFSDERRANIGKAKIGNTYGVGRPCSPETKKKISDAQKGRTLPEARRQKLIGRKLSPETRAKISAAFKARIAAQEKMVGA